MQQRRAAWWSWLEVFQPRLRLHQLDPPADDYGVSAQPRFFFKTAPTTAPVKELRLGGHIGSTKACPPRWTHDPQELGQLDQPDSFKRFWMKWNWDYNRSQPFRAVQVELGGHHGKLQSRLWRSRKHKWAKEDDLQRWEWSSSWVPIPAQEAGLHPMNFPCTLPIPHLASPSLPHNSSPFLIGQQSWYLNLHHTPITPLLLLMSPLKSRTWHEGPLLEGTTG